jgi:predicted nucleic acid-binding protein
MTLYLDTSVISALFDERNPERQALTKDFFEARAADQLLVSELTLAEIENTPSEDLRRSMRVVADRYDVVPVNEDAERLAQQYVETGAVSDAYTADAYHIAIAVACTANILVSWNFRHIVRRKTRDIVNMVNTAAGYPHMEIVSPGELL